MVELSTEPTAEDQQRIDLAVGGMTCASCAARVEKKLNKLDGAVATVNYATEKARVLVPQSVSVAELVTAVEQAGYTAQPLTPAQPDGGAPGGEQEVTTAAEAADAARDAELDLLRRRTLVSALLSVPVILLAMVPPLQFTYWQWLSLTLAAPVVVWGAWPFHRATWTNLRHGAATMDTLISIGTLAALGWSLYALFLGTAGMPGMRHEFTFTIARGEAAGNIYLEVAAGVTTFILLGRYFELRARRRAGDALRALLDRSEEHTSELQSRGHLVCRLL